MKRLLTAILLVGLLLAPGGAGHAQDADVRPGPLLVIYADDEPSTLFIPAPETGPRLNAATLQVNFIAAGATDPHGYTCQEFPAAAQTAYLYAAAIWAAALTSSVPIRVSACWTALSSSNILGSAGPYLVRSGSLPRSDTFYPFALADAMVGYDPYPTYYDIVSRFNSTFSAWHFGAGSVPPAGKYDFASVVLHEIGHGLGFSGSMDYSAGQGSVDADYPYIYDRFTENAAGTALLSLGSPSAALGTALTSAVYFDGPAVRAAYGDRIPLYAPSTWSGGSSYAHVGEVFNGTANALMTYSASPQELIHSPGPVTLALLADLGWSIVPVVVPPAAPGGLSAIADPFDAIIRLSWSDASGNETGFEVYRSTDNAAWALIATPAANAVSFSNTGLIGGTRYYYRLRAVNSAGASAYSTTANAVTSGAPPAPSGLSALAAGEHKIKLTWSDNSNIETGYEVERSPNGSTGWAWVATTAANAASYTNSGLNAATPYYYRVRAVSTPVSSAYSTAAGATTWSTTYRTMLPAVLR